MCTGPSGSGGGGNSNLKSYTNKDVSSMSKREKLDELDRIQSKVSNESRQLFNDTRSGNMKPGSQEVKREVNRISKVTREIEIAKDSVFGYSKQALENKYNTSRVEGSKTSKSDINNIYKKWGDKK